jgi:hypothetical protein
MPRQHFVSCCRQPCRSDQAARQSLRVKFCCVQTEPVGSDTNQPKSKLTGGQKSMIAGLLFLQIPSSLIFYPLAAIFAITGIFVPIAMVLMGIGTLPFTFAMRFKDRWQGAGPRRRQPSAGGRDPLTARWDTPSGRGRDNLIS